MTIKQWTDVDAYVTERLLSEDSELLESILKANAAAGLPAIDVSPAQGKFLNLMVKISGARRILEIGTLGAYSTVWMAKALPSGGRIVSLEYSTKHAIVARGNLARAGVQDRAEVRIGAGLDLLPTLEGPFDMVFIDADKPNNPGYLECAIKLSRPGTVIVLDNVVRDGRVIDATSSDPGIVGTRAAFDLLSGHPRIDSTALQMVGLKGWDGFVLGVVREP